MNTQTKSVLSALIFDPFIKMMGFVFVVVLIVVNSLVYSANTPVTTKSYDCLIDTEVVVNNTLTCELPAKSE